MGAPLSNFTQQIATFTIQPQNLANDGTDIIAKFISGQGQGISNAANNPIPLGVTAGDGGVFFNGGTINISAVPEPSSLLFGTFLAGLGIHRLRRKRAA